MIYVISEDIGSGLTFWKIFFNTYFERYEIIKRKYSGNQTLMSQLDEALAKSNAGDTVFIAFDKIYSGLNFDTGDFLNAAIVKCKRKNVKLYVTSYFCFEEMYLSYPELENIIRLDGMDTSLAEIAKHIRELIASDESDYFYDNKLRDALGARRKDALKNREHFADAALYYLTNTIRNGRFTINKSKSSGINKCWTADCKILQENAKQYPEYMCNNCCFAMKENETKVKLDDMCVKSVIANKESTNMIEKFAIRL